jgi:gamma-glutamyl:cysteine ligase YbdK (ATP-grasp superfamily)
MGLAINRQQFEDEEYERFSDRLQENLIALERLLARPGFGLGPTTLGAELEVSIVGRDYKALPVNRQVLARNMDPRLQLELDRFNLEFNLDPTPLTGAPFSALEDQLGHALDLLDRAAAPLGGRVVPIGILPTLTADELGSHAMTDLPRYHALNEGIKRLRQSFFEIDIDGQEPLRQRCDAVTLEGANTSFQIHLRVNPGDYADMYNAAQLATPIALALAANSPTYVGHRLWDETRVALFKQSTDSRGADGTRWRRAARVPFGHGWVRRSVLELFAEAVALHPPLLPILSDEEPVDSVDRGQVPALSELRLHQGTIWQWNRAVYDDSAGGHLRIELRAFGGGPTPIDMAANAAFLIGMMAGLRSEIAYLLPRLPFRYAEYNFYRAAQHGLDAVLLWPTARGNSPREAPPRAWARWAWPPGRSTGCWA